MHVSLAASHGVISCGLILVDLLLLSTEILAGSTGVSITDIKSTSEAVVIIGVSSLLSESFGAALPGVGLPGGGLLVQVDGLFEEGTWVIGCYLVSNLERC